MRLNKIILLCCFFISAHALNAQITAQGILDNVIDTFKKNKSMSATFIVSSTQGQSKGVIIMEGNKFKLSSDEAKSWYDGKTQWTFSTATNEVNITLPTDDELQMGNPYYAINNYNNYKIAIQKSDVASNYLLKLTPKIGNSQFKEIYLSITKNSSQIVKAVIVNDDNSTFVILMNNYKVGVKYPQSTFVFNKAEVPAGTVVVDLR